MRKSNFVEWAMRYRQIVILCVACLVAFGVYSLLQMRRNLWKIIFSAIRR